MKPEALGGLAGLSTRPLPTTYYLLLTTYYLLLTTYYLLLPTTYYLLLTTYYLLLTTYFRLAREPASPGSGAADGGATPGS